LKRDSHLLTGLYLVGRKETKVLGKGNSSPSSVDSTRGVTMLAEVREIVIEGRESFRPRAEKKPIDNSV